MWDFGRISNNSLLEQSITDHSLNLSSICPTPLYQVVFIVQRWISNMSTMFSRLSQLLCSTLEILTKHLRQSMTLIPLVKPKTLYTSSQWYESTLDISPHDFAFSSLQKTSYQRCWYTAQHNVDIKSESTFPLYHQR